MNRFGAIAAVILMGIAYYIGFTHGHDRAEFDITHVEPIQTIVSEYPYADVCSTMLEAAWSIEDAAPSVSPHKP